MTTNTNGTKVELKYPLTIDGKQIDALYVRRVKVKDLLNQDQNADDMAASLALMGKLTGINPPDLQELDMVDFRAASKVVEGFLGLRPETSEQPSKQ